MKIKEKCKFYFRIVLFLIITISIFAFTMTQNIPFWLDATLMLSIGIIFGLLFEKEGRKYLISDVLVPIIAPAIFNLILCWISNQNVIVALLFTCCMIVVVELCTSKKTIVKAKVILARIVALGIALSLSQLGASQSAIEFSNLIRCDITYVKTALTFIAAALQILMEVALRYAKNEWTDKDNYMYIGIYLLPLIYVGYVFADNYSIFIKLLIPVYCALFKGGALGKNLKSAPAKLCNSVFGEGIDFFKFNQFDKKVIQKSWSDLINIMKTIIDCITSTQVFMRRTVDIYCTGNVVDRYLYPKTEEFNWKVFSTWSYKKLQKFMV